MTIQINPEDINRYVAEQILQSSIGDALKKAIDDEVKKMSRSYDNPYPGLIKAEIIRQVTEILHREEYQAQIKELVRAKLTEEFLAEVFSTLWDRFADSKRF